MTPQEIEISKALNTCTYVPGSFEKIFARSMAMKTPHYEPRATGCMPEIIIAVIIILMIIL